MSYSLCTNVQSRTGPRPAVGPRQQQAASPSRYVACRGTIPRPRPQEPQYYPGVEEEYDVSHDAFHRAFDDAKPESAKIPGLQEFAAAIYERRRLIPSGHDPLAQIFDEFDRDSDGVLQAPEIAEALNSRGVQINTKQVQWLIDTFEKGRTCSLPTFANSINRSEWSNFVYSLTISDLHVTEDVSHKSLSEDTL